MSDERDCEYHFNKRPGRTYISKTLPNKYTPAVRIVSTIFDGKEGGQQFAKVKDEIVLRQTHLGRREIKATVTEDERRIQTLTVQKFSTVTGPYERTHFSFVGSEIDHLLEFIIGLRTIDLPDGGKRQLSEQNLRALVLDQGQARSLFARNSELFRQLTQSEDLERDLIAVGYRRNQLEHFQTLLGDPDFFAAERVRLGVKSEALWQGFFERNPWIFGYGLSYQFMTGLEGERLEAFVRGFDVSGSGKRVDALMKTRGQIGSLCFVEIKRHDRALLDKDAYRSGAWAPTGELVGGVAQIQATVHSAVEQFGRLLVPKKDGVPSGEELFNVEPRSVLVMGRLAEFETSTGINADKVRSFELFRRNTWRPEIITYDELLERARFIVDHAQQETDIPEFENKPTRLKALRARWSWMRIPMNESRELLQATPLRIGISTRALFNLEEEHAVFVSKGVRAYAELQLGRENSVIGRGTGFEVVERLLRLNEPNEKPYVEVVLLSQNSPDLSLRAFNSVEHYGLAIKTGSFTSGRSLGPFIPAWGVDLFLSNEHVDVLAAISAGAAAAKLGIVPPERPEMGPDEVRIAFDGDAVVFSEESDEIYKKEGLPAFLQHERENANKPMAGGPFGNFLKKLSLLRHIYMNEKGASRVRVAIVTARNAPAHARVILTLRAWGTPADEAHFVGLREKAPILKAFGAHIFFDDQEKHFLGASTVVPAGHVPGPHSPDDPVIPAG